MGVDTQQLRTEMHVEAEQPNVGERCCELGDAPRIIEGNAELVAALPGEDVLVRGVDGNLWVHTNRHGCAHAPARRDLVEEMQLHLRFDIDEQDPRVQRFGELALRLPYSAEDNLLAAEPRLSRAKEFAAGNDVRAGTERTDQSQNGTVRVCLERIVNSVRYRSDRLAEQFVPVANRRATIDIARRARGLGDGVERHALTTEDAGAAREARAQYALAHTASEAADFPQRRQRAGASAERNSSSGRTRIVALVSSLIVASHAASPNPPAYTNPPSASMISLNRL